MKFIINMVGFLKLCLIKHWYSGFISRNVVYIYMYIYIYEMNIWITLEVYLQITLIILYKFNLLVFKASCNSINHKHWQIKIKIVK